VISVFGSAYTPITYFFLALGVVAFGVEAWAFIDAITRPSQAFVATGKRTKRLWLIILGVAVVVGLAGVVYKHRPDVDPAGCGVRRGRRLPGRRPAQGEGVSRRRRNQFGPVRPLVSHPWPLGREPHEREPRGPRARAF
jgi:hypothetical protein